jgi:hypothetical protein
MKSTQREVFIEVACEIDGSLCSFCKYAEWSGSCCDNECECGHPIAEKVIQHTRYETSFEMTTCPGEDCWGFKPAYPISDVADIVGLVLSEGFTDWSYQYSNKRGRVVVYGRKPELVK